ncbi:serine/threonine-protein kinase [Lentzea sp. BCCO 10_0856]|uniref:non-specific serine/threonine protein kinase n=1 Tax=Lentzea miocenica TaxID=3095431 RepID=A0ABU4T2L6_9PSEU|nr:serine/threonine-protein kinase [Lentzea sp. BCCO 10_0856]MDX8032396.1 serine/threonine-protein kinase [Lentzea sp. BCCO 10_0856]
MTTTIGGRYTLLERIGSGAMGVVWRARDEVLAREVAAKQLLTGDHPRAMREARNAARLHHPHAIAVFDVISDDEVPWIVMEYLPSLSLSALITERGPLKPAQAASIGAKVASALAAAHTAGMAHRDIKPGNVLIGHDGTVKITDFGISKATGDGTMTDTGMISGTPAYLAPEVARGEQPDFASDVFSLGATLYTAIEGESVFGPSDNSFGLIYRAASGQLRDPKNAGELTPLLTRLLAIDPKDRPTAQEAADELAAEPQPSQPLPIPVPVQRRLKAPNRRILVILSVIAVLAIGGGAAAAYWNGTGGGSPTNQSSFPTEQGQNARYFTAEEALAFVKEHYALLPGNSEAAWLNFWDRQREPKADFVNRWKGYTSVQCTSTDLQVHSNGPHWVVPVDLTVVTDQGETRKTTVEVTVGAINNEMKIVSITDIGR